MLNVLRNRPLFAQFAITYVCNSRCTSCWYWIKEPRNELTLSEIEHLVDELWDFGIRIITITGGEPFVRADAPEIIRLFFERGFRVTINTNGMLLDKPLIEKLSDIGKLHIVISLDSLEEETYFKIRGVRSLNHILETLSYLHKETIHDLRTFTTVSSHNYSEVPAILDYCREHGYAHSIYPVMTGRRGKWFTDHKMISSKEDNEKIATLFDDLANRSKHDKTLFGFSTLYQGAARFLRGEDTGKCGAGEVLLQVSPEGKIAVCPELGAFCDIRKENLKDVYRKMEWRPEVERCYTTTPCYIGCTRTLQSIRNAPLGFVVEALLKWKGGRTFRQTQNAKVS